MSCYWAFIVYFCGHRGNHRWRTFLHWKAAQEVMGTRLCPDCQRLEGRGT